MNISDSISICNKAPYPGFTFSDSTSVIHGMDKGDVEVFPYNMVNYNRCVEQETTTQLLPHLKEGIVMRDDTGYGDWILLVVIFLAFAYTVIRSFFGKFPRDIVGYMLIRRQTDAPSGELSSLLHGKATFIYFISFINLALFVYCAGHYYNLIPSSIPGPIAMLVAFAFLMLVVFLRQLLCSITGLICGQSRLFNEYIISIYNSYKFLAILLFIITILIIYTHVIPAKILFIVAFTVIGMVLFVRFVRLFLSFQKSNISIFYLILYLCALENLPVAILIKYMRDIL